MSATGERVRGLIGQEAADWFVANRGAQSARERERFAAWLRASPVHVEEYLGVAAIARDLRDAGALAPAELEALIARARADQTVAEAVWPVGAPLARRSAPHAFRLAAAAAVLGALAIALTWWQRAGTVPPPVAAAAATVLHLQAGHGQQLTRTLADGSVVHLNTDSTLTVAYQAGERRVTLLAGEALFEVAHAAGRPFRVLAGQAQVVALGTRFNVRLAENSTTVTVAEGRVQVGPSSPALGFVSGRGGGAGAFVPVGADQQIRYAPDEWPAAPQAADAGRTSSWLRRQISFEREPLESVAREFNRYSAKPIEIATPALRSLRISGVFATDDTEAFVAFLRTLDGVRVEVSATRIRVSQRPAAPVH